MMNIGTFSFHLVGNTIPILLDKETHLYAILGTFVDNTAVLWFSTVVDGGKWCEGAGPNVPIPPHFEVFKKRCDFACMEKEQCMSFAGDRFYLDYKLNTSYTLVYKGKVVFQLLPHIAWTTVHYTKIAWTTVHNTKDDDDDEAAADQLHLPPPAAPEPAATNTGCVEAFVARTMTSAGLRPASRSARKVGALSRLENLRPSASRMSG